MPRIAAAPSILALLASLTLHLVILISIEHFAPSVARRHVKGIRLPPFVMEVVIHPPEQSAGNKVVTNTLPPEFNISEPPPLTPTPMVKRLLTQPPEPIAQEAASNRFTVPGVGVAGINYFPASALTVHPKPTTQPKIRWPKEGADTSGKAVLTVYVNVDGHVDAVIIGQHTLPLALQEAVKTAFQNVSFWPGEIDGQPVPSVMMIEVNVSMFSKNKR